MRDRHTGQIRQTGHVIVERLQRAAVCIAQQRLQAVFRLAGIERDAKIHRLLELWRDGREHGDRARHMEPANDDINAERAEAARQIHCARILIGLHADQPHNAGAGPGYVACDSLGPDSGIGLVVRVDYDRGFRAQDPSRRAIHRQSVQGS